MNSFKKILKIKIHFLADILFLVDSLRKGFLNNLVPLNFYSYSGIIKPEKFNGFEIALCITFFDT